MSDLFNRRAFLQQTAALTAVSLLPVFPALAQSDDPYLRLGWTLPDGEPRLQVDPAEFDLSRYHHEISDVSRPSDVSILLNRKSGELEFLRHCDTQAQRLTVYSGRILRDYFVKDGQAACCLNTAAGDVRPWDAMTPQAAPYVWLAFDGRRLAQMSLFRFDGWVPTFHDELIARVTFDRYLYDYTFNPPQQ